VAQYDLNLREYWWIFKKRKFVILGLAIVLGFFSTAFALLKAPDPLFSSVCTIKFERETTIEGLYAKTIKWSRSDEIKTQTSIIKSFAVFQKVAQNLGLIPLGDYQTGAQTNNNVIGIIESLQSRAEVTREDFTNILHIKVTDRIPEFAQKLANAVAMTYREFHAAQQMKRTTEAIRYINDRLKAVREKLREAEDEFSRFSQENELISIELQSDDLFQRTQKIKNEVIKLEEDKAEFGEIFKRLNPFIKDPSGAGHDFYSTKAKGQYQSTNETLVGLLIKRATLLEDYTLRHPEVETITRQAVENARKMVRLLQLQTREIEKRTVKLQKELEGAEKNTRVLLDKKLEFNRLKRNVALQTEMTGLLEQKHEEALIRQAEKPEEVTLVKPAHLPSRPINPPKTMATGAMGILIGVILGLVTAFIVETFDTSLAAIEDVEETLGVQVLGIVPQADIKDVRDRLREEFPDGVTEHAIKEVVNFVSHFVPKSMMAESFRALRTSIQFQDAEKKIKTIAITSTSLEEGKTLVALNLALTMAQSGIKILLVGCDLRKPTIARSFGVERAPGVTDILLGNHPWRDTVKSITDVIIGKMTMEEVMMTPSMDNLYVITSGAIPPNPAELIDSERMDNFIREVKKEFDFVIFDSTPILSTADAAILGTKVDGLLLVYRVGSVSRGLLRRSVTQLKQVNCNVMGVVLNGMRPEISPDFQDFKYYSYYYSYGEDTRRKNRRTRKVGVSFLRKKEDRHRGAEEKISQKKGKARREKQVKQQNTLRLTLLLIALAFLVMGVLWQNGILGPLKWLNFVRPAKEETIEPTVTRGQPETNLQEIQVAIADDPERAVDREKATPDVGSPAEPEKRVPGGNAIPGIDFVEDLMLTVAMEDPAPGGPSAPEPKQTVSGKEALSDTEQPDITEGPSNTQKSRPHPYSIQLGAYKSPVGAGNAVSTYGKKGLPSYWVKVLLTTGRWYRVFTGHFESFNQAENFAKEHGILKSMIKKTPYANLIGIYSSENELAHKMLSLKNLGFSPYVIGNNGGPSRLLVGGFSTKSGAERQFIELKSNGIQSRIVDK